VIAATGTAFVQSVSIQMAGFDDSSCQKGPPPTTMPPPTPAAPTPTPTVPAPTHYKPTTPEGSPTKKPISSAALAAIGISAATFLLVVGVALFVFYKFFWKRRAQYQEL
jgi:hypothetical protein